MSKEVFIALIKKDIEELDMIAQGLYETSVIPPMMIKLAARKTQDILDNLTKLSQIKPEVPENKIIEPAPPEISPAHAKEELNTPAAYTEIKEDISVIETPEIVEIIEVTQVEPISNTKQNLETDSVTVTTKKSTLAEKIVVQTETKVETISKGKESNSLGNSLANKKVTDLKQAISLSDRFRFQRELFAGNAEAMNQALSQLNAFESYEAAFAYVQDNYTWDTKNENVADFLSILHRRFS